MKRSTVLCAVLGLILSSAAIAGGWASYDESMAKSWEAAYNTGDASAVVVYYAEDGMRMPPNLPAVEGREAIAAQITQGREAGAAKVRLETDEYKTSGDMGWTRGTYVIIDPEGNEVDNGKWMQVAKKIDGRWYAYRDIWNSDNPIPE